MAAIQGKWHATAREDGVVRYVQATQDDGEEFIVAKVWAGDDDDYEGTARLVAAAPELLAALKEIADECERRLRKGEDSGDRLTLQLCNAAIAKAEGRGE